MTNRLKTVTSLTTLALFGLALTCDGYAGPDRDQARTVINVQSCIAEIAKHADYDDGYRVIHWVTQLDQRNLVELEIRVNTTVYRNGSDAVAREYYTSCVTASLGKLVEFRINGVEPDADAQVTGAPDATT